MNQPIEKQENENLSELLIDSHGNLIRHVMNPTVDQYIEAVRDNPFSLSHIEPHRKLDEDGIKEISDEDYYKICMAAIEQNGEALRFVKTAQTPEMCMAAVKQDGEAVKYVKNQIPEICMAAVKQNYSALQFVEEQTPEMCAEAVRQSDKAWKLVGRRYYKETVDCLSGDKSVDDEFTKAVESIPSLENGMEK